LADGLLLLLDLFPAHSVKDRTLIAKWISYGISSYALLTFDK